MLKLFRPTLFRYVLREFATAFAISALACTVFMLLGTFFVSATEFGDYGVSLGQMAALAPYLLPKAAGYALPPAAMIAVIMVFGRLAAESEILAAQAGGAPIRILAVPVIIGSLLVCALCYWCNDRGLSWGYTTIREQVIKIDKPDFFANFEKAGNNITLPLDGGMVARINLPKHKLDPGTGKMRRPIQIAYFEKNQVGQTVLAEDFATTPITTKNVLTLKLMDVQTLGARTTFSKEVIWDFKLPDLSEKITIGLTRGTKGLTDNWHDSLEVRESMPMRRAFMLDRLADFGAAVVGATPADPASPALAANAWNDAHVHSVAIFAPDGALNRMRADRTEFWRKVALSALPLSLAFLGIGLGLLVRRSQRLIGFLLGVVVYALIYYPMMIVTKEMAVTGKLGVWAMWIPNIVLFIFGYAIWRLYERGFLSSLPGWMAGAANVTGRVIVGAARVFWAPFALLRKLRIPLIRRIDSYMALSFLVPLVVVLLAVAFMLTALDLAEHGTEVLDGIRRSKEPASLDMLQRERSEAIVDVLKYYGIRSLEIICDILPLIILLAAALCVNAAIRNQEHIILKSAGVSLRRAFVPIIIVAFLFSLGVTALRETVLPDLTILRDSLRAYVYHRNPSPAALALHTTDADGKPVLFEMSQYKSTTHAGRDLRIYLLGEAQGKRIPVIEADQAVWDGADWKLATLKEAPAKPGGKTPPPTRLEHGYIIRPELELPPPTSSANALADAGMGVPISIVHNRRVPIESWTGNLTPLYIESDRLGPSVMRLDQLDEASLTRPVMRVDWWRRVSECLMGIFLLWITLPLMLSEDLRGPVLGWVYCILIGALYWSLNLASAGAAREDLLPVWGPLIPHASFGVIGLFRYWFRLPT